mmetsp:Transcript_21667/g.52908  ORF Transcript_21667/g.52908 Transcript_21667/m.52908 type:complete len:242 (-) Transcript_21667:77-802(-)
MTISLYAARTTMFNSIKDGDRASLRLRPPRAARRDCTSRLDSSNQSGPVAPQQTSQRPLLPQRPALLPGVHCNRKSKGTIHSADSGSTFVLSVMMGKSRYRFKRSRFLSSFSFSFCNSDICNSSVNAPPGRASKNSSHLPSLSSSATTALFTSDGCAPSRIRSRIARTSGMMRNCSTNLFSWPASSLLAAPSTGPLVSGSSGPDADGNAASSSADDGLASVGGSSALGMTFIPPRSANSPS